MIELLGEHALPIFREFKSRWQEFEQLDQREKLKTIDPQRDGAKYLVSYKRQLKKVSELNADTPLNK